MFSFQFLFPPKFLPLKFHLHVEFLFNLAHFFVSFFEHFTSPVTFLWLIESFVLLHCHFFFEEITIVITQKYLVFHWLHSGSTLCNHCKIFLCNLVVKLSPISLPDCFFNCFVVFVIQLILLTLFERISNKLHS